MEVEIVQLVAKIASYFTVLPILLGALFWNRLNQDQRKIWVLTVIYGCFEILSLRSLLPFWTWLTGEARNLPGLHFLVITQVALVVWIYKDLLIRWTRPWVPYCIVIGFTVFGILNGLFWDLFRNMNPRARAVQCILLLPIIFGYFYHLLRAKEMKRLDKDPIFWISSGFIIYFSGSFLIFIVSNILLQSRAVFISLWAIQSLLNLVFMLFATVAIWIRPQQ